MECLRADEKELRIRIRSDGVKIPSPLLPFGLRIILITDAIITLFIVAYVFLPLRRFYILAQKVSQFPLMSRWSFLIHSLKKNKNRLHVSFLFLKCSFFTYVQTLLGYDVNHVYLNIVRTT